MRRLGRTADRAVLCRGPRRRAVHVAGGWRGTAARPGLHQAGLPLQRGIQPFFHRLEQRYRDAADFVGVIDADADSARAYAAANKVPYRVLADPDRAIIARFEARNGGYVALLGGSGQLETLWPGCSAEMMQALGRRIADLRGLAERPLDVSDMPKVLTTGCPFAS